MRTWAQGRLKPSRPLIECPANRPNHDKNTLMRQVVYVLIKDWWLTVLSGLQFCPSWIVFLQRSVRVFTHSIFLASFPQAWKSNLVKSRTNHWSTTVVYSWRTTLVLENDRILVVATPLLCSIVDRRACYSETFVSLFRRDMLVTDCSLPYCPPNLPNVVSFVILWTLLLSSNQTWFVKFGSELQHWFFKPDTVQVSVRLRPD